ncbi:MAG: hypothetical protein PHU44_17265 [Syntrophales bacterium]|nr:hypothetical protein [Syntrophales bacterium]MDD5642291.1 hypothetical protein [Syntrophales bacterium]
MRKSSIFLVFIGACSLALGLAFLDAHLQAAGDLPYLRQEIKVVETLQLTDLCLATEARHTRHPSQADWHSPFQSHPGALDHFPSGGIIQPPETVIKGYEPHRQ